MSHVPKLDLESAEKIMSLFVAKFLTDCGFHEMLECVPAISPPANTLKETMVNETVDIMILQKK